MKASGLPNIGVRAVRGPVCGVFQSLAVVLQPGHYGKMPVAELIEKHLPGWSESVVMRHASNLGLTRKRTAPCRWTPDEDAVLRQWYGKIPMKTIMEKYLPRRTIDAIYARTVNLGLAAHDTRRPWTETENEIVRKYYATIPLRDLAAKLPRRTSNDIRSHAKILGLELGRHNQIAWDEYRRITEGETHGTKVKLLEKKEPNRNSSTGIRGVSFDRRRGKYRAGIQFQHKAYSLGYYGTPEEAAKARAEGMEKLRPILDTIKTDIAGMKDELVAQAVRTAAELRQAAKEN